MPLRLSSSGASVFALAFLVGSVWVAPACDPSTEASNHRRSHLPDGAVAAGGTRSGAGGSATNDAATNGKPDGSLGGRGSGGANSARDGGGAQGKTGGASGTGAVRDSGTIPDGGSDAGSFGGASVVEHHNSPARTGVYVDPAFTRARAPSLHLDPNFKSKLVGNVYAQLLFVDGGPSGRDLLFAVTESDNVYAIDATTGAVVWKKTVGVPAPNADLPCGNIDPLGITGTPIIDLASRTLFVDAVVLTSLPDGGPKVRHLVYGLSIDDGSVRSGWPVDLSAKVAFNGVAFDSWLQAQRGALAIWNGALYIPFSGHAGDCRQYHGWAIGIPLSDPQKPKGWATPAIRGGSWGPSGIASNDTGLFMTTGNTSGATSWMGGEAVIHFTDGPTFDGKTKNYFAPSNWPTMDQKDQDLGGTGPLLMTLPGSRPSNAVFAFGKNGVAYLLDSTNLGGVGTGDGTSGEGVFSDQFVVSKFITAAAGYRTKNGTYVVARGAGIGCVAGSNLVALKVIPGAPPSLSQAWCANQRGQGSPIVTTTDGISDPIVWGVGGDSVPVRITAFDGDTGAVLIDGSNQTDTISNVRRFIAPIVAKGRLYVAGDNAAYAFELGN